MAGKILSGFVFYVFLIISPSFSFDVSDAQSTLTEYLGFKVDLNCARQKMSPKDFENMMAQFRKCVFGISLVTDNADEYSDKLCGDPDNEMCSVVVHKHNLPCLSDIQRTYLKHFAASDDAEKNVACKDNAKVLRDLKKVTKAGKDCFIRRIGTKSQSCSAYRNAIRYSSLENKFSEENCRNREKDVQCVARIATECNLPEIATFYWSSYHATVEATPCKKFYGEEAVGNPDTDGSVTTAVDGSDKELQIVNSYLSFQINWNCVKNAMSTSNFDKMMTEFRNCEHIIFFEIEFADEYANRLCNDPNTEICSVVAEKNQLPCLSDIERNHIQHMAAYFTAQKNYACRDNSKVIKDLQKTSGKAIDCLGLAEFKKCVTRQTELDKLENRFTEENCRKAEKNVQCFANVVKQCDAPELAKFYIDSHAEGARATPCKIVTDNQSINSNTNHTRSLYCIIAVLIFCALILSL